MSEPRRQRWFENQRMAFIAETLTIFGFINRQHLMRKFGVSEPQASKDLNRWRRDNPSGTIYNTRTKRYERV